MTARSEPSHRPMTRAGRAAAAENHAARRAAGITPLAQIIDEELRCPECGATRRTPETLRVHRWLAHDVKAAA